jgi:hypothetical protein
MWSLFGFQTYPAMQPGVIEIKVKTAQQDMLLRSEGKVCDLSIYFNRPFGPVFDDLKYVDFFKVWDYGFEIPARFNAIGTSMNDPDSNIFSINCFVVCTDKHNVPRRHIYIYKRVKETVVVRLGMLYRNSGEIWFLRVLMLNKAGRSHDSFLVKDGEPFTTFQNSALAHGFVTRETEALKCFQDSINIATPQEKRALFFMLTLEGYPTLPIYDNEELRKSMYEDWIVQNDNIENEQLALNQLLQYLSRRLMSHNKTMTQYGLPEPQDQQTELQVERLRYDKNSQLEFYNTLMAHFFF